MKKSLIKLALRYNALYLTTPTSGREPLTAPVAAFAARLSENGYALEENALRAVECASVSELADVVEAINEVYGIGLNWAPLVKAWQTPTGETPLDKLVTMFANLFPDESISGTVLPCGHLIPDGTFPLERYNGCPFCGTPFELSTLVYKGQGSSRKLLTLWGDSEMRKLLHDLLFSPVPLDATQADSLKTLVKAYGLPDGTLQLPVRETAVLLADYLLLEKRSDEAGRLFRTPDDLLRFIWYRKTGLLKVIPPKVLIANAAASHAAYEAPQKAAEAKKEELRLHFSRTECRMYASWLEAMPLTAAEMCENMNPRRQMWVRVLRALRLNEYAARKGYAKLVKMLDLFYNEKYEVWAGKVEIAKELRDASATFALLSQRPGLFARSLFANMLYFGYERTLEAFRKVADRVPLRLLFALGDYAEAYFMPEGDTRFVMPPGGTRTKVPVNRLLSLYSEAQRQAMVEAVKTLYTDCLKQRFAAAPHRQGETIYIAPSLFGVPVPVGDRAATVQDASCAVQGERFAVEGDAVRLFMQWGKGLRAQHLDMDLSARLVRRNGEDTECAYYSLSVEGAQHSGDIINIPDLVGTAEYIELDLKALAASGTDYVAFTCNAYSRGNIAPNLVVGWMDSKYPMEVSNTTGVAYDPSTVAHQVRVTESNLSKGLVFGVLDVAARSIVWLEMPFKGQTVRNLDFKALESLLTRLRAKTTVGEVLALKAKVQKLTRTDSPTDAAQVYNTVSDALSVLF